MHSKIINPRQHGKFVFNNRGSCKGIVTYLGHEAREQDKETQFFNDEKSGIKSEYVKESIDANTQGLRKNQEKFFSLVLSPSEEELRHLQHDPEKFKAFTREVMRNYAVNFQHKDKPLSSKDLIWFATIHEERKVKEGEQKGVSKSGSHQHVHIIVSGKDKSGALRLNPRHHQSQFSIREWQQQNGKTFQQMFGYEKATDSKKLTQGMAEDQVERHQERIRNRVDHLNQYFVGSQKIDIHRALAIAEEKQYGKGFFFNLHRLTQNYQKGKLIHNPYHVLETGRDEKVFHPERSISSVAKSIQQMGHETSEEDDLFLERLKKRKSVEIDQER
ncbi:DUF5712 family protein [Catalinimonas sp. 4WD22]|uniref:DUF5712 family protein n=1 Tax=Catalinimonas locisalis TaxID=3133978 RepID=UPI003100DE6A